MTFYKCIKTYSFSHDVAMTIGTALADSASKLLFFLSFFCKCIKHYCFPYDFLYMYKHIWFFI